MIATRTWPKECLRSVAVRSTDSLSLDCELLRLAASDCQKTAMDSGQGSRTAC
jgi:hypothetical protein